MKIHFTTRVPDFQNSFQTPELVMSLRIDIYIYIKKSYFVRKKFIKNGIFFSLLYFTYMTLAHSSLKFIFLDDF